ncbi:MAG: flagellar hook-associated protein FlgK [Alphaproteobacteria bacterium]|nr:flagellar hook-associated protein FlgK [Alphaproteobacteria bacterium]
MSLNGIAASALSALKTNSTALSVVSNNVSNLNTEGYARRIVNQQTLAAGGQLVGVDIASVQRVASAYLSGEMLSAGSAAANYDTQASFFDQLNGLLGAPGDNQSLASQLNNLSAAFATASQAPATGASRTAVLTALNNLASTFSSVSSTISSLQTQVDQQAVNAIAPANVLIKQVFDLNQQIRNASATGDQSSALLDQRDTALANLAKVMDIRTSPQADGSVNVSTTDGMNLVSNTYAKLAYAGGSSNGSYGNVTIQDINPQTGQAIGSPQALDPHLSGGSLKGLIEMRDTVLGGLNASLGELAQQTAQAFNAQANANAAYPAPSSLTGRNTGLLGTDALGFTGQTTLAVTDSDGKLVQRVDVNFDAGTISVNGSVVGATGSTVSSFVTALNSALGGAGTAGFSNGVLSLTASGGNGLVVQDDAANPSTRGGTGFSQFFGLNDVFKAQGSSITATGLSAGDASGFSAGQVIALNLKGPDGDIVKQVSVTTTAGMTMGNVVTALNTAMGGAVSFTLNADGSLSAANSALYSDYSLNVTTDTTQRSGTGVSFSQIFGLGSGAAAAQAAGFAVTPQVSGNPASVGFGRPQITATSAVGDVVLSAGDNSGAIAMQNVINGSRSFGAAGAMAAQTSSISDYVASFYQNISTQSNSVSANQATQDDRLAEAQARVASNSGVNLDEELTNLTTYQQAYAASARLLSVVGQLYDTLLQIQ